MSTPRPRSFGFIFAAVRGISPLPDPRSITTSSSRSSARASIRSTLSGVLGWKKEKRSCPAGGADAPVAGERQRSCAEAVAATSARASKGAKRMRLCYCALRDAALGFRVDTACSRQPALGFEPVFEILSVARAAAHVDAIRLGGDLVG